MTFAPATKNRITSPQSGNATPEPPGSFAHGKLAPLLLGTVILLALGLRFYQIDLQSLWDDEGYSVALLDADFWRIAADTPLGNMPLYYYLISGWTSLAGSGEFSLRYLSLWFGVLLVPLTYLLSSRLYGKGAAVPAAILAAVAPPLIYQSQSARPYTLLPSLFAANLLLALTLIERPSARLHWLAFALTAALAGFTHFYGLAITSVGALVFVFLARADRRFLYGAVLTMMASAIILLPWLLPHLDAIIEYATSFSSWDVRDLAHRARDFPVHFWVGIAAQVTYGIDPGRQHVWTVVPLAALLAGLVLLVVRGTRSGKVTLAYLFVPFISSLLVSLVIVIFNPKYLVYLSPLCLALMAGMCAIRHRPARLLGFAALAVCLALWGPVIAGYYQAPRHEDLRPLVRRVVDQSRSGDGLVVNSDWRGTLLDHYFRSAPRLRTYMIPLEATPTEADVRTGLRDVTGRHDRVWEIFFGAPHSSPTHAIGPLLSDQYARVVDDWYGTTRLGLYLRGPDDASFGAASLPTARFGELVSLRLKGLRWPEQGKPLDGVVASIDWQALRSLERDLGASLRLLDKQGMVWAQADGEPRNGNLHTRGKPAGTGWRENRGLLVPAGTPPGRYDLILAVYDRAEGRPLDVEAVQGTVRERALLLGSIAVGRTDRPPSLASLPLSSAERHDFGGEVALLGGRWAGRAKAGTTLDVELYWQARRAMDGDHRVVIQVRSPDGRLAGRIERPVGAGDYPTSKWSPDEIVRQRYRLPVSPLLPSGTYALEAAVENPDRSLPAGSVTQFVKFGVVDVEARPQRASPDMDRPIGVNFDNGITLLGYSLTDHEGRKLAADSALRSGKTIKVHLYWRFGSADPLNGPRTLDRSYTAFVHLLNEQGRLAAQHDGIPAEGEIPTTSWPANEVIVDAHSLWLPENVPAGHFPLIAGLYDSETIRRLTAGDGRDFADLGKLAIDIR